MHDDAGNVARKLSEAELAVATWKHPDEVLSEEAQTDLVCTLAEALTPVLQFVAKGRLRNTMHHRVWVFLHETRIDLIGGESIAKYAKRAGVDPATVFEYVKEFRACIPAYRGSHQKSAATRAKMSATAKARITSAATNGGAGANEAPRGEEPRR